MVERKGPVWPASDGTYHASAKARDQHEGQADLTAWMVDSLTNAGALRDEAERMAPLVIARIADSSGVFVDRLRKAGVKLIVRERAAKVKPPAEPKKPDRVAAE